MQDLMQAEAKNDRDVGVDLAQGTAGEVLDQEIETALPPERAGDDLRRERAVALVGEALPAVGERRRQIRAVGGNGAQGVEGCGARRRGHVPGSPTLGEGRLKVAPGRT